MKKITIITIVLIVLISLRINAQITVNLKVLLEGPFNGATMNTDLNVQNLIPLTQPYNVAPWNYEGTEQVSSIPNPDIVDWILVELRETTGDASTATPDKMIDRQAAFIKADGSIVETNGSGMITYSGSVTGNLYVIIWHRNHLAIMSSDALTNIGGIYSWDFTNQLSKAYLDGQKEIVSNVFGMIAGDCDGNGRIFTRDKISDWYSEGGEFNYSKSDLNLDSQVDNIDKDDFWYLNFGLTTKIPGTINWECFMDFTDIRDGQNYGTLLIGNQCWMAENLNIGTMILGTNNMANNSIIEKYCYNNNTVNCDVYGGLYQWNEMMQYVTTPGLQGICPANWHLPTEAEWCMLTQFIDPTVGCNIYEWSGTDVGTKMKSTTGWNSGGNGTNASGYNAHPGGYRDYNVGSFNGLSIYAIFWSSSEYNTNFAWGRSLYYTLANVARYYHYKTFGLSVRCLKDNEPPSSPASPQPPDGATNQPINTTLSWSCTDPENDPLTYDVYFGTSNPPELIASGQTVNSYNTTTLGYNTTYYWKIIATDDHNNSIEGPVLSFTTMVNPVWVPGEPFIDERDGQIYETVVIGTQCWLAENLNVGTMIPGTTEMTNNSIIEKYCYDNNPANCDTYGGLYQWNEMMQYSTTPGVKGICPAGWHLPTDAEWTILTNFLGGQSVAGGKMKATGTIEAGTGLWYAPNTGATNESGFFALPGGFRNYSGVFLSLGFGASFWSSTESGSGASIAWIRQLGHNSPVVPSNLDDKVRGSSVRCVQD
jgi:uncharacterized protein (TIGR02145 family)